MAPISVIWYLVWISTRSISSTIEKKSWASQWYQECHQMSQDDWYMDDSVFSHIWVMSSFNLGQICNTQNSAMALNPEDGNYHRRDPAESWHSSTRKAFKLSTCAMFPSPISQAWCSGSWAFEEAEDNSNKEPAGYWGYENQRKLSISKRKKKNWQLKMHQPSLRNDW